MIDHGPFRAATAALDEARASDIVAELLSRHSSQELMDDLLGPTLTWVGERWEQGEWTVAQEHRATSLLVRIVRELPRSPRYERGETALVVAAEGEWHTVPVAMLDCVLRADGFDVVALDGPIPAGQVLSLLHELGPRAMVVSCVMTANLPGLRRMARVARDAGTPVVGGGRALTANRARLVGADAFAARVSDVGAAIDATPRLSRPVPPLGHASAAGFEWIEPRLTSLAAGLVRLIKSEAPAHAVDGAWMLRVAAAALLCNEPGILRERVEWQRRREAVTGESADAIIEALAATLSDGPAEVRTLLDQALAD